MKKIFIMIIIIISFVRCSGDEALDDEMIESILSTPDVIEIFDEDEINNLFSGLDDDKGIRKPVFMNNKLIGEISLFTNKEYLGIINNKYKVNEIDRNKYVEELVNLYNEADPSLICFIVKLFSKEENIVNPDNWNFKILIDDNNYSDFFFNTRYIEDYLPNRNEKVTTMLGDEYYITELNFNISKLPPECRPNTITPLAFMLNIGVELIYKPDNYTIRTEWNNTELYYDLPQELNYNAKGNQVEFIEVKNPIPLGIDKLYMNMEYEDFPFEIPNEEKGLFNATAFTIGQYLADEEYFYKEVVEAICENLALVENEEIAKKMELLAKVTKFDFEKNFLGAYVFKFDNYYIERKLINIPDDDTMKTDHNIKKAGFIKKGDRLIAITYYFDETQPDKIIEELKNLFGYDESFNILQPYSWDDREKRISYKIDTNSLSIIDKKELKNMIEIIEEFRRYYIYIYKQYDYSKDHEEPIINLD